MNKVKYFNLYGSTGQIGSKSLQIIDRYFPSIKINLLVANTNYKKLLKQAIYYKPKFISINDRSKAIDELMQNMIKKLKEPSINAITGSRMIKKSVAIKGGMPIYKFIGNVVLTKIFNILCKTNFTDCHTGFWGYNLKIFRSINLNNMDDGFNFDNTTRISAVNHKLKVSEISINTFYRTEESRWHIIYAFNFLKYLVINIFKKIK